MIERRTPVRANPTVFWPLAIAGWAVIGYGVAGLIRDASSTNPSRWVLWFLGAALVHDLLIAPMVFLIGSVLARRAPKKARALLQAGLIASALVLLSSIPVLLGFGDNPDDPSTLPNDYRAGLLSVLAAIWIIVLAAAILFRSRPGRPQTDREETK